MSLRCPSLLALAPLASLLMPLLLPLSSAHAQSYPSRPVRIVVPLPAGGATDAITRAVTPRLAEIWGQQIVIENKGGANTQIGTEAVAKAAPDGYTLLATAETTVAVNPFLYRNLSYEAKDLVPVQQFSMRMNLDCSLGWGVVVGLGLARAGELFLAWWVRGDSRTGTNLNRWGDASPGISAGLIATMPGWVPGQASRAEHDL